MRSFVARAARRFGAGLGERSHARHLCAVLALATATAGAGLILAGGPAPVEAREYSPYSDPQKPVLSLVLSDPQNVEEVREEFGLSDQEVQEALAAVRRENQALAREYAESERIVEANEQLSAQQVSEKIVASDYDERVRSAVAETKATVEDLLPEGQRSELEAWVNTQWQQASTEDTSSAEFSSSGSRKLRCKVFATQYHGYTRYEVALPHRHLKFNGRPRVAVRRIRGDRIVRPRVKEVGPWNIHDNYWRSGKQRTMWRDLPRCLPEAEAAYFRNYNNGKDEFGRKVLNPAGVDLTPAVARGLGLKKYQNAWVYVRFPWVRR